MDNSPTDSVLKCPANGQLKSLKQNVSSSKVACCYLKADII